MSRTSTPLEAVAARRGRLPEAAEYGRNSYFADLHAPRGRRHVRVCTGTSCFIASGGQHLGAVEAALGVRAGQCSDDGSRSLQEVHCLGYCYAGPAALDGDLPCAGPDLPDQLTGHAPRVDPAVPVARPGPVVLLRDRSRAAPWEVWRSLVGAENGGARVREEAATAGLRGRGGAGYRVARKWEAVAGHSDGGPRYVIANGDEGDPGSYSDRFLMETDPDLVLEGLALAGLACGARQGYAYVRSEYPTARAAMNAAVLRARTAGHLGQDVLGSRIAFDVEVVSGHGSYVAGEETSLLRSVAGLRGTAQSRPPYPTDRGLHGRPTAVNNVETLAAIPAVVSRGGAAYARLGVASEPGTILACLSEGFLRPGIYEVELGTPLRVLVEELGGGPRRGRVAALQMGGPLGGFLAPDHLDLPLLDSALQAAGAALGHGGLVAVDTSVSRAALLAHLWQFAASESCGACTPCREVTRLGAADPEAGADPALLELMRTASMCAFGRRVPSAIRSLEEVPPWS